MNVSLKSLIGKLNDTCRGAMEAAAGLCLTRTHYDVDIEHLFLKLRRGPGHRLPADHPTLRGRSGPALAGSDDRALDRFKTGNARTPALSPRIPRADQRRMDDRFDRFRGESRSLGPSPAGARHQRRSGAVWRGRARRNFGQISVEDLRKHLPDLVAGSGEDKAEAQARLPDEVHRPRVAPGLQDARPRSVHDRPDRQGASRGRSTRCWAGTSRSARWSTSSPGAARTIRSSPARPASARPRWSKGLALRIAAGDVPPPLRNASLCEPSIWGCSRPEPGCGASSRIA